MIRSVSICAVVLGFLAVACGATPSGTTEAASESAAAITNGAQSVNWSGSVVQFDNGSHPSLALGVINGVPWEVEVHQGGPNDMWLSSGVGSLSGTSPLGSGTLYQHGYSPAVAALNTGSTGSPDMIEVHQGTNGVGALWYGTAAISSTGGVNWQGGGQYDYGYAPSVAGLNGYVVEVHQATTGVGPLWYHFGTIAAGSQNVTWGAVQQYDNGVSPSVAIANTASGLVAIEVHASGSGALWYHTGAITSTGVNWGPSVQYDNGYAPSVTVDGTFVIEAHQAGTSGGALWSNSGVVTASSVAWGGAVQYDNGYSPSVAWDSQAGVGREVHAATTGVTALWSHDFQVQTACVPNTCAPKVCGTFSDGCGGTLTCGGCCAKGQVYCNDACVLPKFCY